jgi:hypothetical protein
VSDDFTEALLAAQREREFHDDVERGMWLRFGSDWRDLPRSDIRAAAPDLAEEMGNPDLAELVADCAERAALLTLVIRRADAMLPGPKTKELWETAFIQIAEERGGMTKVARDVGANLGVDPLAYEQPESRMADIPDQGDSTG